MENIGSRIAALRLAASMTQGELASKLGLTSGMAVSRWETGTTKPNAEHLLALSDVLGVPVGVLAGQHSETVATTEPTREFA
jgi:transcriptional regulator with XRE-family HTH domain